MNRNITYTHKINNIKYNNEVIENVENIYYKALQYINKIAAI